MTQITGSQIGGVGRDGLFGIFNPQSDEGQVASGIFEADITTFDPENRAAFEAADVVVGRSRVNTLGEADSIQEIRGIDNSTIELSNGGGRVKGKGVVNGTVNVPNSLSDSFGLIDSTVRGGEAANELQFEAISRGPGDTAARGAQSSTIEGGDSQDNISISALARSRDFGSAKTVGSTGNDIVGGGSDDEIKISATSYAPFRGEGDEAASSRATGSSIDSIIGGEGKNLISIAAHAERGERANATGMSRGLINDPLNSETADYVADTVQISGTANARSAENAVGFANGAFGGAFMINGGSGTIDIRGNGHC